MSIEITRRCNMSCAHCMRGDMQNVDLSHQDIRNVLKYVKDIHSLTLTGGEPSLNPEAIRYILKLLKQFCIHVYEFYIVTNGSCSSISKEFIDVCSDLYEYQEIKNNGNHMLEMSDDKYHDNRHHQTVISTLQKYPYFGLREQSESIYLFREGRCLEGFSNPIYPIYLTTTDYIYGSIYLNAIGMILSNGDLSYQRQSQNVLCHSSEFLKYVKSTLRKE